MSTEWIGTMHVKRFTSDEWTGTCFLCDADSTLILRVSAYDASAITYTTMDAYAQAQGYDDEEDMLDTLGFETRSAYLASCGYTTATDFLANRSIGTVGSILSNVGVHFG